MRKIRQVVGLLSSLLLLANQTLFGQSTNVAKVNVFSPIINTVNVAFEHTTREDRSLQVGVYITGATVQGNRINGFGITPERRYYLSTSREAPAGFYLAPFLRYQRLKVTNIDTGVGGALTLTGVGATAGYQGIIGNRFTLDAFVGPSLNATRVRAGVTLLPSFALAALRIVGIRGGLTVGVAF